MQFFTATILVAFLAVKTAAAPVSTNSELAPRSSQSITINTPLNGVSKDSMLKLVHDPSYMINANGLVTSQTQTSSDPITFEISDDLIKLPFKLPFGIPTPFKTTYTATFENNDDGLVTKSTAGGGLLKLTGTWTVTDSDLQENVQLEGNLLAILVAKPFVQSAHGKMHQKMLTDAGGSGQ